MTDKVCKRCRVEKVTEYTTMLVQPGVYCPDCTDELEEMEHDAILSDDGGWDHD